MTTIINLYGGPGTGKSTSAAYLYYRLKSQGHNVELVREYVKDWAWEGRQHGPYDQLYFLGKQIRKESMLFGKVDYIVTDSPVMLSLHYRRYAPVEIRNAIGVVVDGYYRQSEIDGHRNVHVFLKRSKPYNPLGRYQGEEEARAIDDAILHMFYLNNVKYFESGTDEKSLCRSLSDIVNGKDD